jgi:hypothetical protein
MSKYQELKQVYRDFQSGDVWAECMGWLFAVSDYLTFDDGTGTPDKWQFRPSPLGPDEDSYEYQELQEIKPDTETLERFGNLLNRYSDILRARGMDY